MSCYLCNCESCVADRRKGRYYDDWDDYSAYYAYDDYDDYGYDRDDYDYDQRQDYPEDDYDDGYGDYLEYLSALLPADSYLDGMKFSAAAQPRARRFDKRKGKIKPADKPPRHRKKPPKGRAPSPLVLVFVTQLSC